MERWFKFDGSSSTIPDSSTYVCDDASEVVVVDWVRERVDSKIREIEGILRDGETQDYPLTKESRYVFEEQLWVLRFVRGDFERKG